MKKVLLGAVLAVLAMPAFAENTNWGHGAVSGSASSSEAVSVVDTASQAGAQIITNGQLPGEQNTTYSQARIENAPSLGGLALGGGHPCAYSPTTAQVSIIGGGAGFGAMKVDSACMLMVMGAAGDAKAYAAAQYMIAARDADACTAMQASGMISACVRPGAQPAATVSTKSGGGTGSKCQLSDGKILFRASAQSQRNAELEACKASLGF